MLNLCAAEDFGLFAKCGEAPIFLYAGLIVGEISHEQGQMGWGLGHLGFVHF